MFYVNFILELWVDDLMWKMWDEDVMGILDWDKFLILEEMFVVWKMVEIRCYNDGWYEVVILWIDDELLLYCNRKSVEDRFYFFERYFKWRLDVVEKYC